jgi:uncharacterized LabA/DUF88 family protein
VSAGGPILTRQIAILVDGGFFLRRIEALGMVGRLGDVETIAATLRRLCRRHVQMLVRTQERNWHRHVYRIFYYDAPPFSGVAHHPLHNQQIFYDKSPMAVFRRSLFDRLRQERNVALRLGEVIRHDDWIMPTKKLKPLLPTRDWFGGLNLAQTNADGSIDLKITPDQVAAARRLQSHWAALGNDDVALDLRQKGVDMRIGLDIASLALKRFVNTIVLVTGDSDFVPAAKLARREGVQFILDPLWQPRKLDDLFEHIDGLQSGLPKPRPPKAAAAPTQGQA